MPRYTRERTEWRSFSQMGSLCGPGGGRKLVKMYNKPVVLKVKPLNFFRF